MANIFVSPIKPSSNLMPIEPRTPPSKHVRSVKTERASTNLMARLTATPVTKLEARTGFLPGSCLETKAGPALDKNALDKNSPFITKETKLNFETMQNSLPIQEEESHTEVAENEDPMDICDEQSKSTADIPSSNNNIAVSVYKELENRVAQLRALPSPERKKILGINNAKTPFSENSGVLTKQTSPSSTSRFTQAHEKAFSQMPSIVTHYAAQKTKKAEETQDEFYKKRKDPDIIQPSSKKQKLAHSTQDSQVTKSSRDVYKKVEKNKVVKSVVKKTYDRNRTNNYNRSSMRPSLAKNKNIGQAEVQPSAGAFSRFNVQESLKKQLNYVPYKGPVKSIIPNPDEQRKKEREELEKRKQAARNVAQPVLEKLKNQKKTKENIEQKSKELQNIQNVKIEEKKLKSPSLLPKRAQ